MCNKMYNTVSVIEVNLSIKVYEKEHELQPVRQEKPQVSIGVRASAIFRCSDGGRGVQAFVFAHAVLHGCEGFGGVGDREG